MAGKLVLCRHGQSDWNLKNLFTGWTDVDLTEKGITEAKEAAGRLLKSLDYDFDIAFTSVLKRAIRTLVDHAGRDGPDVDSGDQGLASQ